MKIRKSTVAWFVLAVLLIASQAVKVEGEISKDHIVCEDEMTDSANPKYVQFVVYVMALLFVILGVRSMLKKKKLYQFMYLVVSSSIISTLENEVTL